MTGKKKGNGSPAPSGTLTFPLPAFFEHPRAPLVIAILFLAVMSFTAFTYHKIGDYGVETDFYWTYAPTAQGILHGVLEVDQFKGPGYEFVLAVTKTLSGDFFRAGMLISLLSGAVVIYLTYKLLAKLFGRDAAVLVTVGLMLNYTFLKYSYTTGTDMFFNMLTVLVVYFLLRSDDLRFWEIAVAGALTGYAYVTRYNAIAFYAGAIAGLTLVNYKNVPMKERLAASGVFVFSSLLFVVPWALYCHRETGSFFYNRNYANIAYEMFGKGKVSWDEYWFKMAPRFKSYFDVMAADPGGFFRQIGTNAAEHFWNDVTLLVESAVGIFAFGGILALIDKRTDRRQLMYFVFAFAFYLVLLPVFYGERFSLFLAATILLLAVTFFQWKRLPAFGSPKFGLKHIALVVIYFIAAKASIDKVAADISSGPEEVLQVRDAFIQQMPEQPPGKIIVTRKPHIAYYLNMKFVSFPYVNSIDELLAQCKKERADYLFYSGIEAGMRPQFSYLLDPARAPRQLRPVVQVAYPPAVLYQLQLN